MSPICGPNVADADHSTAGLAVEVDRVDGYTTVYPSPHTFTLENLLCSQRYLVSRMAPLKCHAPRLLRAAD